MNVLLSRKSGRVDPKRDAVYTARERHVLCRPNNASYPVRAIRTHEYLYIRNYKPDLWPAGDPDIILPNWTEPYGDVDSLGSGIKTYMLEHQNDPDVQPLMKLAFGKRPAEELYDLNKDPDQMRNVAAKESYKAIKEELSSRLTEHLKQTGDPWETGETPKWDVYDYG